MKKLLSLLVLLICSTLVAATASTGSNSSSSEEGLACLDDDDTCCDIILWCEGEKPGSSLCQGGDAGHFCPVTCEEGCAVKDSEKRKRAMADLEALLEKKMQFVRDNNYDCHDEDPKCCNVGSHCHYLSKETSEHLCMKSEKEKCCKACRQFHPQHYDRRALINLLTRILRDN